MVLALPARTKRLVLRRFEPQEAEIFFGYCNDPAVARLQSWNGISRTAALQCVRVQGASQAAAPGEWFQIALALAHSNQLVGDVGVCIGKDGRAAELGFTLARTPEIRLRSRRRALHGGSFVWGARKWPRNGGDRRTQPKRPQVARPVGVSKYRNYAPLV